MDSYKSVPQMDFSENGTGVSIYTSEASVSGIYTGEMQYVSDQIISEPLTSDVNRIN